MATEHTRIDPDDERRTSEDPPRQADESPRRILAVGAGMFLPALIILLIAITVILYLLIWR